MTAVWWGAVIAAAYFAGAFIAAGVIGRGIHTADERQVHPEPERAATATARATLPADALWSLSGRDVSGPVAVSLWPLPCGRLGLTVTADGHLTGLRLDRAEVQAPRHAVTGYLVNAAPVVKP